MYFSFVRPFVSAVEMQKLDLLTMQKLRCNSFELMEKVIDALFARVEKFETKDQSFGFLCGPGNNGGDGYLLAEKLRKKGRDVWVFPIFPPSSEDCKKASELCKAKRVTSLQKSEVLVDAIFGTSGRSNLDQALVEILKLCNKDPAKKITLDIPTGIDSKTGEFNEATFNADLTLCIGFPKTVFLREEVAEFLGRVDFIGDFFAQPAKSEMLAIETSDFSFRDRKRAGHKGDFGRCGVIAGKLPGAAVLAAEAASRAGAGYSSIYFDSSALKIEVKDASFVFKNKWKASDLIKENSLVIGCGGLPKMKLALDFPAQWDPKLGIHVT